MSTYPTRLLAAILSTQDVSEFLTFGDMTPIFQLDAGAKEQFEFVNDYVRKTGQLPPIEVVEEETESKVKAEDAAPLWLHEKACETHVNRSLKLIAQGLKDTANEDPMGALQSMISDAMSVQAALQAPKVVDFKNAASVLWPYLVNKWGNMDSMIKFGWPYLDDQTGGLLPGDLISLIGRPGEGKASSVDEPVLLRDGSWVRMGDLKPGMPLASVDSAANHVLEIYPQGVIPTYRVTFSDGRWTEVSGDHLWEVECSRWTTPSKVTTTTDLIELLKVDRNKGRISVPMVSGDFGTAQPPLDPYTVGVLLGDGCLTKEVSFTGKDPEIAERVRKALVFEAEVKEGSPDKRTGTRVWYVLGEGKGRGHPVRDKLAALGMMGLKAHEKSIPACYMAASKPVRLEVLRGLMDTDGTAGKNGQTSFCSTSEKLADQVQELVRSLGGWASKRPKQTSGRTAYIIGIRMPCPKDLFHLERKRDRVPYKPNGGRPLRLMIKSIERVEDKECQCISVSHPRHLYVTRDYVVTHNTWFLLWIMLNIWQQTKQPVLFVSMEMGRFPVLERLAAIFTSTEADFFKFGMGGNLFGQNVKKNVKGKLIELEASDMPPFIVVDGDLTATVDEVASLALLHNVVAVGVDGAYLLEAPQAKNMYEAAAINCRGLKKKLAGAVGIPTLATYQFENLKKLKKGEKPTLDNVGYTRQIGELSSIALGLLQGDKKDNVALLNRRIVDVLKGRGGQTGEFPVNWDFQHMDFSQIAKAEKVKIYN